MDRLPEELLRIVLDELCWVDTCASRRGLKNLRLSNTSLSAAATPRLFKTVGLWLGLSSLQKLTNISEHPSLSAMVEKIVFSPLRFKVPNYNTQVELDAWLERDSFSLNTSYLSQRRHHLAYTSFVEAQSELSMDHRDVNILTRCLKRLPNLKTLHCDAYNLYTGAEEIRRTFGKLRGDEIVWNFEHTLGVVFKAMDEAGVKINALRFGCYEQAHREKLLPSKKPTHLPGDNSFASLKYPPGAHRGVSATEVYRAVYTSANPSFGNNEYQIEHFHHKDKPFDHLRELEISEMYTSRNNTSQVIESVRVLVARALKLRVLTLGYVKEEGTKDWEGPYPSLDSILVGSRASDSVPNKTRTTHLRKLEVRGWEVSESALVSFLLSNKKTLETVDLFGVRLSGLGDKWSSTFGCLKGTSLTRLKSFRMAYWSGKQEPLEETVRVEDFLLLRTDVDPIGQVTDLQASHQENLNLAKKTTDDANFASQ